MKKVSWEQLNRGRGQLGEGNLFSMEQFFRRIFLEDTLLGGNFSEGNIPCSEYKQDIFLMRVETIIKD